MLDRWLSNASVASGGGDQGDPGSLPAGVKAIMGDTKSITRVKSLARRASLFTQTQDALGRTIQQYGEWFLVDLGDIADGSAPIIPIETRDADGSGSGGNLTGLTTSTPRPSAWTPSTPSARPATRWCAPGCRRSTCPAP